MRDPAINEINQILRDDFDPPEAPTCAEELERTGVWPDSLADDPTPPWDNDFLIRNYELLDVDLMVDHARGK